ncbi:class I SAM-dependent methyltransferase [Dactylosporangium sp. CS-047395]|uniref:class I SAM-dependent methyltransferase n=1 Tax=Dactylosporangium sp. CS-047395 TaxID=3239936 RepID=UPI003D9413FA
MSGYDSARLAAAYAFDRPPVHHRLLRSARLGGRARRALDVGCGAGLSTAALAPLAEQVVGLEPVPAMLAHRRTVAPAAGFVVGTAERLPFGAGTFDLVTAAGALNYTDLPAALAEIARVLVPGGRLVLYDFSEGRRSAAGDALPGWFAAFEQRFPWPPGWRPLDPRTLPLTGSGLWLEDCAEVELPLPVSLQVYLRHVLGGLNVDAAVARGACTAEQARDWCRATLAPLFAGGELTVLIPGYAATLRRDVRR